MSASHEQINDGAFLEYGLQREKSTGTCALLVCARARILKPVPFQTESLPRSASKADLSILESDRITLSSDVFDPNLDSDGASFGRLSPRTPVILRANLICRGRLALPRGQVSCGEL